MPDAIPASFSLADVIIPEDLSLAQRQVADEVLVIFAERIGRGEDRCAMIATGWLAERLGWTLQSGIPDKKAASRHLRALVDRDWLTDGEPMPSRDGRKGTKTYLPGPAMTGDDSPEDAEPIGRVSVAECPF